MTFRLIVLSPPPDPARRGAAFPPHGAEAPVPVEPGPSFSDALRRVSMAWAAPEPACATVAVALAPAGRAPRDAGPALREADMGRWSGRPLADVADAEPEAVALWLADPRAAPHGGEALAAVLDRVAGWLDARHGESGTGLAVVPSLVARAACLHALGAPVDLIWRLDLEPGTWADLRSDGRRWAMRGAGLSPSAP